MFPHNCLKKKKGECMKKMCIKNMKHESGRCREYNEGVGQLDKSAQSVFKISINLLDTLICFIPILFNLLSKTISLQMICLFV